MSETVVTIDGAAVTLRPSLRAAYRLEAKHGFKAVFAGVIGGNLSIMADVIELAANYPSTLPGLLRDIEERGIIRLEVLKLPLLNFVSELVGMDAPAEEENKAKPLRNEAPRLTLSEHFESLFEIGTGWLGWTPTDTWAASPAEIQAAYAGRVKLLQTIFGSGEAQPKAKPASLDDKIRMTMSALGAKKAEPV